MKVIFLAVLLRNEYFMGKELQNAAGDKLKFCYIIILYHYSMELSPRTSFGCFTCPKAEDLEPKFSSVQFSSQWILGQLLYHI